MRKLTDHIVEGSAIAENVEVRVLDQPGPGGANHDYDIVWPVGSSNCVLFQKGLIKEVGINGVTNEALLAIVIDRLRGFQDGQFKCRDNAVALTHIEEALMWLQRRTRARMVRGVEGTNVV